MLLLAHMLTDANMLTFNIQKSTLTQINAQFCLSAFICWRFAHSALQFQTLKVVTLKSHSNDQFCATVQELLLAQWNKVNLEKFSLLILLWLFQQHIVSFPQQSKRAFLHPEQVCNPLQNVLAISMLWIISPYSTEYLPLPACKDEDNSPYLCASLHRCAWSHRRHHYQGSGGTGGYWQAIHWWEWRSPSTKSPFHLYLSLSFLKIAKASSNMSARVVTVPWFVGAMGRNLRSHQLLTIGLQIECSKLHGQAWC